jgi:hypothetical protein
MTKSDLPLTLRLPFAMADQNLRLEQILAADTSRSWAQCIVLLSSFAMSRPERKFARRLLERKRNYWLFRCNQRQFCGDFIVVDMSPVVLSHRPVSVIELKLGAELRFGGGGAGNQLQRARAAVTEIAVTEKVITRDAPVTLICGDGDMFLRGK